MQITLGINGTVSYVSSRLWSLHFQAGAHLVWGWRGRGIVFALSGASTQQMWSRDTSPST